MFNKGQFEKAKQLLSDNGFMYADMTMDAQGLNFEHLFKKTYRINYLPAVVVKVLLRSHYRINPNITGLEFTYFEVEPFLINVENDDFVAKDIDEIIKTLEDIKTNFLPLYDVLDKMTEEDDD